MLLSSQAFKVRQIFNLFWFCFKEEKKPLNLFSLWVNFCFFDCCHGDSLSWCHKTYKKLPTFIRKELYVEVEPCFTQKHFLIFWLQVAKALGGLIPLPGPNPNDPRRKELLELEKQKAIIDQKADSLVRRELWLGLAYLVVQTAGFIRLTFWELSWDVMEPICFYVTSMYFMAGYAFFLRTSKEPSFEGFYQSRFSTKQKQLIKANNFDIERYNELKAIFYPHSSSEQVSSSASFDHSEKMQIGALDHWW